MFDEMDWSGRRLEGGWNESYIDDAEVWKVAVAGFLILTLGSLAAGAGIGGGGASSSERWPRAPRAPTLPRAVGVRALRRAAPSDVARSPLSLSRRRPVRADFHHLPDG
jgi:hypothetical protein